MKLPREVTQASPLPAGDEPAGLSPTDLRLEMAIEATRQAFLGAVTRPMKLELQEQMRQLISQRSVWAIAVLERQKGLR